MSDGGRESGSDHPKKSSSGGDEFGGAVARIAVAQICESVGFHSSHGSALNALADIAIRFICTLGNAANFYANSASRTEGNVFDLIQGLEELGNSHGFSGAPDVHRCLASSGVVREIVRFMSTEEEVPFPRPVPSFPIVRDQRPALSFAKIGEKPAGDHIPDWLPPFPDPHTYIQTPVCKERESELRAGRIKQERLRRNAEQSPSGMQQRLICNGKAEPMLPTSDITDRNPFFMPPLAYGEKPVSDIIVPGHDDAKGKRLSVIETFVPAIKAAEGRSLECEITEQRDLSEERPCVRFSLGTKKKRLLLPSSSLGASDRSDSRWLKDDEKGDRKRKAENILKAAMENGKELIQM
ncbi:transcription initiation factor TFIID subunit 8-like [Iris pallida]|uniref:Transcription initiation factor TFIID subunit 8 n=1 Tax=Iris pallida TaxID=29817 RepID=A0AAX6H1N5_IRIPA|nr:transcription initiation factor TFIID subunit 8-like [Iris pallida]